MEKVNSSISPAAKKRPKKLKATMPKVVSEPKNIKTGLRDVPEKLDAAGLLQAKSKNERTKSSTAKILQKPAKPLGPLFTKTNEIEGKVDNDGANTGNTVQNQTKKHKKLKRANPDLEPTKNIALPSPPKKKKKRKSVSETKDQPTEMLNGPNDKELLTKIEEIAPKQKLISKDSDASSQDIGSKYSILKNKELIDKFMKVPLNNNQKGRIRQAFKLSLEGTPKEMFPELINAKIEAMMKNSTDLTDSDLRRIRILYNMLKTSLEHPEQLDQENKPPKKKKDKKNKEKSKDDSLNQEQKKEVEKVVQKVKGPKRYVVFLGNLPLNVTKEKIMDHFKELNEQIKDIRIPKPAEGKKSAIAYVELSNEPSYELALSKHHSMMGNKRIKALYTTQQNSKISRAEAKVKSAKLIALQKAGKLIGSVPITKKRSHRRAIMKAAKAKEAAAAE